MKNDKDKDPTPKKLTDTEKQIPSAPPLGANVKVPEKTEPTIEPQKKPEEPKDEPDQPEDEDLDKAVDDIATKESDDILEAEDEAVAKAFEDKKPSGGKLRNFFRAWWENKFARWTTILVILGAIAGVAVVPTTRYYLLNVAGVRSSASITIVDESTRQPLRNVKVSLNNATGTTDDKGAVKLNEIKLGSTELTVERRAFAPLSRKVTIGWGSNPLGEVSLKPSGLQYSLVVKDVLSGKAIEKAEAISGDASAFSDKDGKILLTLDTTSEEKVEITIKAVGYRDEKIIDKGDGSEVSTVKMVAGQKQAYISKRSGKYDVYKIDADGKNEALVLSGTGFERDDMTLVSQPTGDKTALVSTRENQRNASGELLSSLTLVDIKTNKTKVLDTSDQIQIIGWVEDTIVYVKVGDKKAANGAKAQNIVSYNAQTDQRADVTSSTYFNDVIIVGSSIYYAPAADAVNYDDSGAEGTESQTKSNTENVGFFKTDVNGLSKERILNKEVWNVIRSDYDTLILSAGKDWHEYSVTNNALTTLSGPPANQNARVYTNNSDNQRSLWVDKRDGKGVLISYDVSTKKDKVLVNQSGLAYPVRWLNSSTAVFRIHTEQETADYVVSVNGGEPKKLADVTNTAGIEQWYYF